MKSYLNQWICGLGILGMLTGCSTASDFSSSEKSQEELQAQEEENVRATIQGYLDAINQKDLDRIPGFWVSTAVYKNPITGDLVEGREGIKKEFKKIVDQFKEARLEFKIEAVRFPTEAKAAVEGKAMILLPGEQEYTSDFKMILVKDNQQWLIMHVSRLDFGVLNAKVNK